MDRAEGFCMREMVGNLVVLLAIGCAAPSLASGQNQSKPMGPPPQPDPSRIQEEMTHATAPSGPLKITFGGKTAEWTSPSLAALPHNTITVYNEHAKANQTYSACR
jgi:hypothetical protein